MQKKINQFCTNKNLGFLKSLPPLIANWLTGGPKKPIHGKMSSEYLISAMGDLISAIFVQRSAIFTFPPIFLIFFFSFPPHQIQVHLRVLKSHPNMKLKLSKNEQQQRGQQQQQQQRRGGWKKIRGGVLQKGPNPKEEGVAWTHLQLSTQWPSAVVLVDPSWRLPPNVSVFHLQPLKKHEWLRLPDHSFTKKTCHQTLHHPNPHPAAAMHLHACDVWSFAPVHRLGGAPYHPIHSHPVTFQSLQDGWHHRPGLLPADSPRKLTNRPEPHSSKFNPQIKVTPQWTSENSKSKLKLRRKEEKMQENTAGDLNRDTLHQNDAPEKC